MKSRSRALRVLHRLYYPARATGKYKPCPRTSTCRGAHIPKANTTYEYRLFRGISSRSRKRVQKNALKKNGRKSNKVVFLSKSGGLVGCQCHCSWNSEVRTTCLRRTYNMPKELAPSKPQQHCLHKKMNLTIPIPVSQLAWMGVSEHFFSRFPHAPGPPVEKGIISLFISVRIRT